MVSRPETLVELLKSSPLTARGQSSALRYKQDKHVGSASLLNELLDSRSEYRCRPASTGNKERSDRVAILAESGPLWTISDYAILSLGAVNIPIYPTQPPHQVEYILRESEPKLLTYFYCHDR